MATTMYLPEDLVEEEILSRVPLTSLRAVRYTCKTWNALSRNQIFGQTGAGKPFTGFMVMDSKLCSMEFDLERLQKEGGDFPEPSIKEASIFNNQADEKSKILDWEWDGHWKGDLVDPSIKQASLVNQAEICQVFHWDGLLLCVIKDKRWRVVWNPYLGQVRWIEPINKSHKFDPSDMYALGYDDNNNNRRNHKILRLLDVSKRSSSRLLPFYEMYDFYSDSWKILDVVDPGCHLVSGVPLKGNTYFLARENIQIFLLCFDFTAERFGTRLALPFGSSSKNVLLSCVRDEKLAVLHFCTDRMMEIWITTKIELNAPASWSRFLRVEFKETSFVPGSFFIDEEKKVAVVSELLKSSPTNQRPYQRAYIFGVDGYLKCVNIGKSRKPGSQYYNQLVFSSYAPSLVKLRRGKRKVVLCSDLDTTGDKFWHCARYG